MHNEKDGCCFSKNSKISLIISHPFIVFLDTSVLGKHVSRGISWIKE